MPAWARSDAEKSEKRLLILGAAFELFRAAEGGLAAVADVAAHAGLAKGTVYLYFRTKEEIFLAMLEEQLHSWIDRFTAAVQAAAGQSSPAAAGTVAALASQFCAYPLENPALLRLASLSHGVLERNIDAATALRFKRSLAQRLEELGRELDRSLTLAPGHGARMVLHGYALLLGLWQLSEPAPVVRAVLAQEELSILRYDFARDARAALEGLWLGALKPEASAHPATSETP